MRCLHACHLHRVCRRALVAHASSRQQAGHVRYCASSATAGGADVEWAGLHSWRRKVNEAHSWSTEGVGAPCSSAHVSTTPVELPDTLSKCGRLVLSTAEPDAKMRLTHAAFARWCTGSLALGSSCPPASPALPERPLLVAQHKTPTASNSPLPLNSHVLHTLAHIEYNAVNLAWDTITRFADLGAVLPAQFFSDFARVADDEARHLGWCLQRLHELGHSYGELPSHNALWEGAAASADDIVARLVVVPCIQEARGLDAGPKLTERLIGAGDPRSAAIVRRISEEEQAHVAVGVRWLNAVASARSADPGAAFRAVLASRYPDGLKGPFNHHVRQKVGLPRHWYAPLESLSKRMEDIVAAEAR